MTAQHEHEPAMFLDSGQLTLDPSLPVPRAQLSRRVSGALWALRLFVIVVSAMVIYTFVSQVMH
jgi:hypothetical protein